MPLIRAKDEGVFLPLCQHEVRGQQRLLKGVIAAAGGDIGPGCPEEDGGLPGRPVVHGADKVGGAGKLFARIGEAGQEIMGFRECAPAGSHEHGSGFCLESGILVGAQGQGQRQARQPFQAAHQIGRQVCRDGGKVRRADYWQTLGKQSHGGGGIPGAGETGIAVNGQSCFGASWRGL